jgi:hypothetical protein
VHPHIKNKAWPQNTSYNLLSLCRFYLFDPCSRHFYHCSKACGAYLNLYHFA